MTDAPVSDADAFRRHAREIAAGRLLKARGLLAAVSPDVRLAIEQAAYAVAAGVADCLLQEAAKSVVFEGAIVDSRRGRGHVLRGESSAPAV
jgi:hypothetical protein